MFLQLGTVLKYPVCILLVCSRIMKDEHHTTPVFCLKRNPYIKDLYVSVGSKKFALWSEKLGVSHNLSSVFREKS